MTMGTLLNSSMDLLYNLHGLKLEWYQVEITLPELEQLVHYIWKCSDYKINILKDVIKENGGQGGYIRRLIKLGYIRYKE